MYYRGAHAAILVYDITSAESLADIQVWLDELRRNMSSDLIVQIVGHKADLAPTQRRVELAYAKGKIEGWLNSEVVAQAESAQGEFAQMKRTASFSPTQDNPPPRSTGSSAGLSSYALTRSISNRSRTHAGPAAADASPPPPAPPLPPPPSQPQLAPLPAFRDIGISEVSAKEDAGIEDLFLSIASKLVERRSQIEHDRVLRTKNSVMLGNQGQDRVEETARGWRCC